MKKEELIKYALIAAALYAAYRYMEANGLLAQWFGIGAQPQPQPQPVGNNAGQILPGTNIAPPAGTQAPPVVDPNAAAIKAASENAATVTQQIDEKYLARAAANSQWAGEAQGAKLTWDQWEWYLQKFAKLFNVPAQPMHAFEDSGMTDRYTLITAAQYHDLKAAKGLSGLLQPEVMTPYRRWTQ
jgi:hypothetical protein